MATKTYTRKPRNLGLNRRLKNGATLLHIAKNEKARRTVTMALQAGTNVKYVNIYQAGKPTRSYRVDAIARGKASLASDLTLVRGIAASGWVVLKKNS